MNGRGYDYNLGRFLSVDPFIQSPVNSQSPNPYSYIGNNPLSGTDPSGYLSSEELRVHCQTSDCHRVGKRDKKLGPGNPNITTVATRPPSNSGAGSGDTGDAGDMSGGDVVAHNSDTSGNYRLSTPAVAIDEIGSPGAVNGPRPNPGLPEVAVGDAATPWWQKLAMAAPQLIAGFVPGGDAGYELIVNQDIGTAAKSAGLEVGMTLTGAAIGSVIPVVGTAAGAAIGYTTAKVIRVGRGLARLWRKWRVDVPNGGLRSAGAAVNRTIAFSERQLQRKFKHAGDFGVTGNYNSVNRARFQDALQAHVADDATVVFPGTYMSESATLFFNPNTGNVVVRGADDAFVTGFGNLSPGQLDNLLTRHSLGGH